MQDEQAVTLEQVRQVGGQLTQVMPFPINPGAQVAQFEFVIENPAKQLNKINLSQVALLA